MKSYRQYCGVARGLDVVGDRWSLLIIRELALAECRYGALQRGLPGIATNLLADRLRELVAAGVVEQRTQDGAPVHYALSDRGRALVPTLHALVRWTTPDMLPGPAPEDHEDPRWLAFAAQAYLQDAPPSTSLRAQLVCSGTPIVVAVDDGAVSVALADDPGADLRVKASSWALMAVVSGSLPLDQIELLDGDAATTGTQAARRSLQRLVAHNTGTMSVP